MFFFIDREVQLFGVIGKRTSKDTEKARICREASKQILHKNKNLVRRLNSPLTHDLKINSLQ
jgi:hypothetical protein